MGDVILFEGYANIILIFLVVYIIGIVLVGIYYSKKINDSDDHALAGRGLTFPYLVASVTATWICAGALMGATGAAYLYGMQGVIFDPWSPFLTLLIIGFFLAYRLRRAQYTTMVDFFESRLGRKMAVIYMIMQLIAGFSWIAGQLVALGIIIFMTTGFSLQVSIVIATIAIIMVTYAGGLWALSRLDAFALILIIAGLLVLFPAVINGVGGWSNFVETATVYDDLPAFAMTPVSGERGFLWYTGPFGILLYLGAWLGVGLGDTNCTTLTQRILAAKDEKTATYGFLTSGVLYLFLGLIPATIGIALYTWGIRVRPDNAEYLLLWATSHFLPSWGGVLFVLAMAAVIVSTCGENILVDATLMGHNIYRYFKPNATKKDTLKAIRISVPIVGLGAMAIGLFFGTVYKLIVFAGAVLLPTVTVAYFGGLFWKKANHTGSVWSFITGTISWILFFLYAFPHTKVANTGMLVKGEPWMEEAIWDALYIAVIPAFIVSAVTLVVVSLLTAKSDPPKPIVDADGNSMENTPLFYWSKNAKKYLAKND
ncbi:sodium:solute symporter family transporter [Natronincola ferrireducens]|uniref:Na+/proline symporter n=1 Tax=Natronincola ferrireducens TaxID=393762 RepID=A0A1G8YM36_9FIRM|nr:hypothetical protein [Natronincola ferrireducens]SDK03786.1 Na+/proline symporter [Natronincola ferrireducens]